MMKGAGQYLNVTTTRYAKGGEGKGGGWGLGFRKITGADSKIPGSPCVKRASGKDGLGCKTFGLRRAC